MSKQILGINGPSSKQKIGEVNAYSAQIQEAMRYDKLPSSNYVLVMTILHALARGYTEEQWQAEHWQALKVLINQPIDPKTANADLANRYEQTIGSLKDLSLWPW